MPDLSAFQISDLADEIRRRSCAVVVFQPSDIFDRFDGATADAVAWMGDNATHLEEMISERGNAALDDLLMMDGKARDEDDDSEVIGWAVFQGEAWVNDHAVAVDDARHRFPVTEREYAEAWAFKDVQYFDGLQEAAGAPPAVKNWSGPFTIRMDWSERKSARAAYLEDPEAPDFDADEIAATMALLDYSDAQWEATPVGEQAVLIDQAHR